MRINCVCEYTKACECEANAIHIRLDPPASEQKKLRIRHTPPQPPPSPRERVGMAHNRKVVGRRKRESKRMREGEREKVIIQRKAKKREYEGGRERGGGA
jgi:hypothetical protein